MREESQIIMVISPNRAFWPSFIPLTRRIPTRRPNMPTKAQKKWIHENKHDTPPIVEIFDPPYRSSPAADSGKTRLCTSDVASACTE